ncbi:MAG: cobyric acid synthase [Pseudomonadota bacterium]|nr:cobyric acid synthase [Pseudomonadota bacterium]
MTPALMVQGTASGVGKSWVATAICAALARRGLSVAPFKAWNMSNNAAPAWGPHGWGEIGRAQAVQARAAGRAPTVDMNPLLLKPMGLSGADVVVCGRSRGPMRVAEYQAAHDELWAEVTAAYARLAATADVVVLEGAGSPAEINLRGDMANMEMARHAGASVLLVGDIDKGGVFASLYGTVMLLPPEDRARVAGLVVNRFRGDPSGLQPGLARLATLCGVPVRGVLPFRDDVYVDDEDAATLVSTTLASTAGAIDVCVLHLPTVANATDLGALGREPGVGVRYVADAGAIGNPDLLVIPGSRDTEADLRWVRGRGLDRVVVAAAARGIPLLGLCGGYQMLGARLGAERGLGLLPVDTEYAAQKEIRPVRGVTTGAWLLPAGLPVEGYEIHAGRTIAGEGLVRVDGAGLDGAVVGLVAGTYVHGLLDSAEVRGALVAALRERRGLDAIAVGAGAGFDALADVIDAHLDLSGLV